MNLQKNKKLFTIQIDNVVDIITNSSSELFVLKGEEESIVKEMIKDIYPDYELEYTFEKLSESDKQTKERYIDWVYDSNNWSRTNEERISKYTKEAEEFKMTPNEFFSNWEKSNRKNTFYANYSDEALKLIMNKLDPNKNIYCLWSIDENPNWEMQEELMNIGTRYHLG